MKDADNVKGNSMWIVILLTIIGVASALVSIIMATRFTRHFTASIVAIVAVIFSVGCAGYASKKYEDIKYNEIEYCIENKYEVYIDGSKVDPQNIDLRNYKLDNIKIDNDAKKVLISIGSSKDKTHNDRFV